MKSEILVVNAVKSSERAFSVVAEHVDSSDLENLLKVLQNPEKVMREEKRLGLTKNHLFVFLEQAIREAFERRPLLRLTRDHLSTLMEIDVQKQLSRVLVCPAQDVLQNLFSVPALQDTFEYLAGTAPRFQANVKFLLTEILKPGNAQQLEINYTTTSNNWEPILENEEWLVKDSAQKLLEYAVGINSMNPYQILANLVDQRNEMVKSESDVGSRRLGHFDALALLEIRRRLSWIISRLYDQSIELSENITRNLPDSPVMRLLVSLIYIYELGSVAKGIENFISTSHKLQDKLPENSFFGFPLEEDKINIAQPLVYIEEKMYSLREAQVGNFEVRCLINGREQTLLKVIGAPSWICQQLKQDIPRLAPKDLNLQGENLFERLLNTSFPIEQVSMAKLKEAVNRLEPEFTQATVLASNGTIMDIPTIWEDSISNSLQFDELPIKNDPVFIANVDDQIAYQKSRYGYQENSLTLIIGFKNKTSLESS